MEFNAWNLFGLSVGWFLVVCLSVGLSVTRLVDRFIGSLLGQNDAAAR
jgi:hypothetical protein